MKLTDKGPNKKRKLTDLSGKRKRWPRKMKRGERKKLGMMRSNAD